MFEIRQDTRDNLIILTIFCRKKTLTLQIKFVIIKFIFGLEQRFLILQMLYAVYSEK